MINRLKLILNQPEFTALVKISLSELRTPADQVRYILRQELTRRGVLKVDDEDDMTPTETLEESLGDLSYFRLSNMR